MKLGAVLAAFLLLSAGHRLAAAADAGGAGPVNPDPIVATVSGIEIPASEFKLIMHRQMPSVVDYFFREYALEDRAGYWADTGDPNSPIVLLREKTLSELRRIKTQLVWAAKLGLPAEPSFPKLREQLSKENARRAAAVPPQTVIYGPKQYALDVYYDIQFSESAYQLRQKLAEEAEISEEKIRQAYEARKSEFAEVSFEQARTTLENELALDIAEDRIRGAVAASAVQTNDRALAAVKPRSEP